ncbi:MAG: hypothetical protein GMKNLPBB_00386 [Myxococcota bacterium]|nr:hypothetical protein [Myxococcota bacterium]
MSKCPFAGLSITNEHPDMSFREDAVDIELLCDKCQAVIPPKTTFNATGGYVMCKPCGEAVREKHGVVSVQTA